MSIPSKRTLFSCLVYNFFVWKKTESNFKCKKAQIESQQTIINKTMTRAVKDIVDPITALTRPLGQLNNEP